MSEKQKKGFSTIGKPYSGTAYFEIIYDLNTEKILFFTFINFYKYGADHDITRSGYVFEDKNVISRKMKKHELQNFITTCPSLSDLTDVSLGIVYHHGEMG